MNITVYTKTGCSWCNDVLDWLKQSHIDFEERNVTNNQSFFDEMVQKSGQTKAPTVDIDGTILADTDVEALSNYLKNIPKTV